MNHYLDIEQSGRKWPKTMRERYATRGALRCFTRSTKLCAIGSCFAVNLMRWLAQHGIDTITPPWGLHYNSYTIKEEFLTAIGQGKERSIWRVANDTGEESFYDAQRHPLRASSPTALQQKMQLIESGAKQALYEADLFVITLGLSQVWEQRIGSTWTILNRAPLAGLDADLQFRCRYQSITEIIRDLSIIIRTIDACSNDHRPVIFTISPVPLKTSGTRYDARIANSRSKSILLAALHEHLDLAEKLGRRNIAYFPAFEQFQYTEPNEVIWQKDGRHIVAGKINEICLSFCDMFCEDPAEFPSLADFEVPIV